jgi:hypothetical protein
MFFDEVSAARWRIEFVKCKMRVLNGNYSSYFQKNTIRLTRLPDYWGRQH